MNNIARMQTKMIMLRCVLLFSTAALATGRHWCDIVGICNPGQKCVRDGPNAHCKDICTSDTCPEDMTCVVTGDTHRCDCPDGTKKVGESCQSFCPTSTGLCPTDSYCFEESDSEFSCECSGGDWCLLDCKSDSCPNNMKCSEESDRAITCTCPEGFIYTQDGGCVKTCNGKICGSHEVCTNAGDIQGCCRPGFELDPITGNCFCPDYKLTDGGCVDTCSPTFHSCPYDCSKKDFFRDSAMKCTCDNDECPTCSTGYCPQNMECQTLEDGYQCACSEGYTFKHGVCEDVDECLDNSCPMKNAECWNTRGSYKCKCPVGTFYNITSDECQDIDECLLDVCDTKHLGVLCENNQQGGYGCYCPEGAPDDCDYFNEITPCNCELNEVCLRRDDGTFYCTCDLESRKLGSECVQISLPFSGNISVPEGGHEVSFRIGYRNSIKISLSNHKGDRLHWKHVTWLKKLSEMLITRGSNATKPGRFSTPKWRQRLVIDPVLPEDEGTYEVIIKQEGLKTVSETFNIHIVEPLEKDGAGVFEKGDGTLKLKVKLNCKLDEWNITWYRTAKYRGITILPNDGRVATYQSNGKVIVTAAESGTYIAELRGVVAGFPVHHKVNFAYESVQEGI